MFSKRALIRAALRDEPATDDTVGEGRSQEHHLCSLNSGSHALWPCIILHNISTLNPLTSFRTEPWIEERQDSKPIEIFCEQGPTFVEFFNDFLLFSYCSSLFLPAQTNKLYQQIQLSNAQPPSLYDQKPISASSNKRKKKKKKESGQFSGER